jgi:hypothetical protein
MGTGRESAVSRVGRPPEGSGRGVSHADAGSRQAIACLAGLALLAALIYWALWVPAYRLGERFEYVDLLLEAHPWIAGVLATQLAFFRVVAPATLESHHGTTLLFMGLWAAAFVLYVVALRVVGAAPPGPALALILAATLAFQATLLPIPGLFTTDLFSYAFYGEVAGRFGGSPYLQAPDAYPAHPLYLLINPLWRDAPSVYGPVWIAISGLVGQTLGGQVLAEVTAYRGIANLCHWANLGLVWWLTRRLRPGHEALSLAVYGWNPLVVFEFAASGHNDGLMILFLLLSIGLLARDSRWRALGALVLSVATKYTTLLVLPIALWWIGRGKRADRRLAAATAMGAAIIATVAALYIPWWRGPETLGPIVYWLSTPLYAHYAPIGVANWLRDVVVAAGWLDFDAADYLTTGAQRQLVRLGFVAYLAFEAMRLRRVEDLPLSCARALLVFLLVVNTWVLPWYYTWPLSLVAVGEWRSRTGFVALGLTISAPLAMYWAQVHFDGMQPSGYIVYLAPLSALALWEIARRLRGGTPTAWALPRLGWR